MRIVNAWLGRLAAALFALAVALPATAPAQTSSQPVAAAETYTIHPGDQLGVQVFGDPTLTQDVMVLDDGTVVYPLLGSVHVAGETADQAATTFKERLLTYERDPIVTVSILKLGQPTVMVLGNVKNPGKYQLPSNAHLTDAIAAAGGLGPVNGLYPDARVSGPNGNVTNVSLERLLRDGDVSLDRALSDGSVVYVPSPITFNVDVLGAVDHPGKVQLERGDTLSVAIAKAGNSAAARADLNRIFLTRLNPDGKKVTYRIDLYRALQSGDSRYDVQMQKGDVVFVPQETQRQGGFLYPLLYVLRKVFLP
ncbi:MAG: polysaccharide biosynthesis/export family protein [Vulcanimicrobiaceae bacterium]